MDNENHIRVGKLNLVDLAGSERQTKTGSVVRPYVYPPTIYQETLEKTYGIQYSGTSLKGHPRNKKNLV